MLTSYCDFIIINKIWKIWLTSDFYLRRYTQVNQVQSSMNVTNPFAPKVLEILDGPHISEWIKEKGDNDIVLFKGNGTLWCFANSQASQWKNSTSIFLNKEWNILSRILNAGCPKQQW